ncbi:MAG: hypothetical protein ACAF41_01565 [Leptolyngbya sp. BL-A-14]
MTIVADAPKLGVSLFAAINPLPTPSSGRTHSEHATHLPAVH